MTALPPAIEFELRYRVAMELLYSWLPGLSPAPVATERTRRGWHWGDPPAFPPGHPLSGRTEPAV